MRRRTGEAKQKVGTLISRLGQVVDEELGRLPHLSVGDHEQLTAAKGELAGPD